MVTHETSWVPACTLQVLLLQHPALPVAVELFCHISITVTLSRKELPARTWKQTHSSHSVQKALYVAAVTGRNGPAPKMGWWAAWVGSAGESHMSLPCGAGQAQPAPKSNTARATASQECQGVENTHGLGLMDWAYPAPHCLHMVPNPTSPAALSVLASQVVCLTGQGQGSLIRAFSSVCIWWGVLPFCASSWALFFSTFLSFPS